jgi:hypothetical protein
MLSRTAHTSLGFLETILHQVIYNYLHHCHFIHDINLYAPYKISTRKFNQIMSNRDIVEINNKDQHYEMI